MDPNKFYEEYYATQIDFRYNRKTKTYSVLRLNTDPSYVLYKDGITRKTTQQVIDSQLKQLTD
jgi:hypothetical protein